MKFLLQLDILLGTEEFQKKARVTLAMTNRAECCSQHSSPRCPLWNVKHVL
jgi:hypothetical protein